MKITQIKTFICADEGEGNVDTWNDEINEFCVGREVNMLLITKLGDSTACHVIYKTQSPVL